MENKRESQRVFGGFGPMSDNLGKVQGSRDLPRFGAIRKWGEILCLGILLTFTKEDGDMELVIGNKAVVIHISWKKGGRVTMFMVSTVFFFCLCSE